MAEKAQKSEKVEQGSVDAVEAAEAVVEKRESYDVNKPKPADQQVTDVTAEVETEGEKSPNLVFVLEGSEVVASIGKTSVRLDREAILGVQRAFSKFGAQI